MISRRAFIATAAGLLVPAPFAIAQRFRRLATPTAPTASAWVAGSVAFDGSSWLDCSTGLFSDSKTFTFSGWFKPAAGTDGNLMYWLRHQIGTGTGSYRFVVRRYTNNKVYSNGANSGAAEIYSIATSGTVAAADGWCHVAGRGNLASANDFSCWINGVAQSPSFSTWTNDTIDFEVGTPHTLIGNGSTSAASQAFTGEVAEFWFSTSDIGASAGTAFFAGGKPVYLGPTGAVAGVTPQLYLSRSNAEPVSAFLANRGSSGGTFTQSGTITLGSSLVAR